MKCPVCGYTLDEFDVGCPKCATREREGEPPPSPVWVPESLPLPTEERTKKKESKRGEWFWWVLFLGLLCSLVGLLLNAPPSERPTMLCDALALVNQSAPEVDDVLGTPTSVESISTDMSQTTGEARYYQLARGVLLMIEFYNGKALKFSLWLSEGRQANTPEQALVWLGLEISGCRVVRDTITRKVWTKSGEASLFKEVWVAGNALLRRWTYVEAKASDCPD